MAIDPSAVEIVQRGGQIELTVKVVPGASRTRITGVWGTALRVAVSAPPEAGKANAAVTKLLAAVLGVRKADVEIISGKTQAVKRIAVFGLTADEARERLARS